MTHNGKGGPSCNGTPLGSDVCGAVVRAFTDIRAGLGGDFLVQGALGHLVPSNRREKEGYQLIKVEVKARGRERQATYP